LVNCYDFCLFIAGYLCKENIHSTVSRAAIKEAEAPPNSLGGASNLFI
jgi:hypothetical protein